jgi:hypothetical protein
MSEPRRQIEASGQRHALAVWFSEEISLPI